MCGLMSVNGDAQAGPTRVGIPLVDHLTGYVALTGILMALRVRDQTGRGQQVEATLFDTALSMLVPQAANWLASGKTPERMGSAHPNIAPYDKFAVSDGEIFLGIVNDSQFQRFCDYIDRPALGSDARFASNSLRLRNRAALQAEIEDSLRQVSAAPLCAALMHAGVPAGVVNSVPEAFAQPQASHRQLLVERDGYKGVRSPARLYGTPGTLGCSPPTFAQDSVAVLKDLGYDDADIARLQSSGTVPAEPIGPSKRAARAGIRKTP
jgi:crotonobetainyl-CoA:carnitine CoA-transferase CaiB-like acyl-CoA transferase